MTWIQQALAGFAMVMMLCVGSYMTGMNSVQKEWDKDKAVRAALAEREKQENAANLVALKDKFEKDINHAKTKAYRDGRDDWLRKHGLLPSGLPVRGADDSGQANIPQGTDATTSEYGTAERITEFANRCIDDARKVEMCAEWAARENLPVE